MKVEIAEVIEGNDYWEYPCKKKDSWEYRGSDEVYIVKEDTYFAETKEEANRLRDEDAKQNAQAYADCYGSYTQTYFP